MLAKTALSIILPKTVLIGQNVITWECINGWYRLVYQNQNSAYVTVDWSPVHISYQGYRMAQAHHSMDFIGYVVLKIRAQVHGRCLPQNSVLTVLVPSKARVSMGPWQDISAESHGKQCHEKLGPDVNALRSKLNIGKNMAAARPKSGVIHAHLAQSVTLDFLG